MRLINFMPNRIAVMQPYLFPYIGYYQLISAVDTFIQYDTADYITGGWINRNNILLSGKPHRFTLPLQKASQNKAICETTLIENLKPRKKILKTIRHAYNDAPYFQPVFELIQKILLHDQKNLATFLDHALKETCAYLEVKTTLIRASDTPINMSLEREERLIDLTHKMGAQSYINPIGAKSEDLYHKERFEKAGLELFFIKTAPLNYDQGYDTFTPNLSIIDVMMFNTPQKINTLLQKQRLI